MIMAIKELKEILKDWPDSDDEGESNDVWIETGLGLSSPVTNWCRLNNREEINSKSLLLESNAFEDNG